jgi:steroid delta-isomerase-like uncharacterized protein
VYDEAANGRNLDVFDEIISEDSVDHNAFPGMSATGPEAYKRVFGMSFVAFHDIHMAVDSLIAEGDRFAAQITISGTHQGEFIGIPATEKAISMQHIEVFEVKDGKITARWGVADRAGLMEQLGLALSM